MKKYDTPVCTVLPLDVDEVFFSNENETGYDWFVDDEE